MERLYCKNCAHFYQHYALNQRKIFRVYCGHCSSNKLKAKRPDTPACTEFVYAPQDEDSFASKEYLSKELLQYLLNLELLPKIEDMQIQK